MFHYQACSFHGFLLQLKMSFLLQKNKEYVSIAKGGFMGKLVNGQLSFEKTYLNTNDTFIRLWLEIS